MGKENNSKNSSEFTIHLSNFINNKNYENEITDKNDIYKDALILYNSFYIKNKKAIVTQEHTRKEMGDIIIDGNIDELKYVTEGNGTYFNTSMSYFHDILGFIKYNEFLEQENFFNLFENTKYNQLVSKENNSPVSQENALLIMEDKIFYKKIVKAEKEIRKRYINYLYEELKASPEKTIKFINDMISKENCGKEPPDRIVIFNKTNKTYKVFFKEEVLKRNCAFLSHKNNSLSLCIGDNIRVAVSWQNGTGLNNPTIRVFI